jgi:hypothetical protein
MRTSIGAAFALGLVLAGCGGAAPERGNQLKVAGPEATQNRLETMPEGQRNAVFIRAIRDSGQQCQHVESSARAGDYRGLPLWSARCDNGVTWTIVLGNDGSAAVLNPAEAAAMNGAAAQNRQ